MKQISFHCVAERLAESFSPEQVSAARLELLELGSKASTIAMVSKEESLLRRRLVMPGGSGGISGQERPADSDLIEDATIDRLSLRACTILGQLVASSSLLAPTLRQEAAGFPCQPTASAASDSASGAHLLPFLGDEGADAENTRVPAPVLQQALEAAAVYALLPGVVGLLPSLAGIVQARQARRGSTGVRRLFEGLRDLPLLKLVRCQMQGERFWSVLTDDELGSAALALRQLGCIDKHIASAAASALFVGDRVAKLSRCNLIKVSWAFHSDLLHDKNKPKGAEEKSIRRAIRAIQQRLLKEQDSLLAEHALARGLLAAARLAPVNHSARSKAQRSLFALAEALQRGIDPNEEERKLTKSPQLLSLEPYSCNEAGVRSETEAKEHRLPTQPDSEHKWTAAVGRPHGYGSTEELLGQLGARHRNHGRAQRMPLLPDEELTALPGAMAALGVSDETLFVWASEQILVRLGGPSVEQLSRAEKDHERASGGESKEDRSVTRSFSGSLFSKQHTNSKVFVTPQIDSELTPRSQTAAEQDRERYRCGQRGRGEPRHLRDGASEKEQNPSSFSSEGRLSEDSRLKAGRLVTAGEAYQLQRKQGPSSELLVDAESRCQKEAWAPASKRSDDVIRERVGAVVRHTSSDLDGEIIRKLLSGLGSLERVGPPGMEEPALPLFCLAVRRESSMAES